jgi:hypothetical protein
MSIQLALSSDRANLPSSCFTLELDVGLPQDTAAATDTAIMILKEFMSLPHILSNPYWSVGVSLFAVDWLVNIIFGWN